MESPFEVLGVGSDAGEDAVRNAYRERVKDAHPDHGGTPEEFRRVREAYEAIRTGHVEQFEADSAGEAPNGSDDWRPGRNGARSRAGPSRTDEQEARTQVEYLNYEVLDDRGWRVDDADLFRKAADAGLEAVDYGEFEIRPGESLLEAAERRGYAWPFACRGGACANCAVVVREGDLSLPVDHILPQEMVDRGIYLSCNAEPTTEELKVLYNVKHMPDLEDLLLPPRPFRQAYSDD